MTDDAGHYQVRTASIADGDSLTAFLSYAAADEHVDRYDVLGYLQDFVLPIGQVTTGQLFIATRGWSIVGLASVVFRHDGDIEIDALLIDPSAEREKIGRLLIAQCAAFAREAGARALFATVNEQRTPELAGWGFAPLAVDESILGSVAVKMRASV